MNLLSVRQMNLLSVLQGYTMEIDWRGGGFLVHHMPPWPCAAALIWSHCWTAGGDCIGLIRDCVVCFVWLGWSLLATVAATIIAMSPAYRYTLYLDMYTKSW